MLKIQGNKKEQIDFVPLKKGDLLYHEGPLLSHFVDSSNQERNLFYRWVDGDKFVTRWLIFDVSRTDLLRFFNREYTLRGLIEKNDSVYIIDLNAELRPKQIFIVGRKDIPDAYLPAELSYFQTEHFEDYALALKAQIEVYQHRLPMSNTLNDPEVNFV